MSDPSGGELSPGTSPSQPSTSSPSSQPSSTPSFVERRAAQPPAGPRERKPAALNPRSERPPHWSDKSTAEGRAIAAARARRGETPSERPGTSAAPTPDATPGEQQRTAGDSEQRFKIGNDLELTEAEVRGLMERHALEQSRKATLPATPDDYKLEIGENFVVPQGIELRLDPSDPAVPLARQLMHDIDQGKVGGQEAFSRLVEIHAAAQIAREQRVKEALASEVRKLGASGTPRVTAIHTFMDAVLGTELAKPFKQTMVTEAMVRGWEKILQHVSGQGAGSYSTAHREAPASNGKIEGYESMTFEQRRAAQSRMNRR